MMLFSGTWPGESRSSNLMITGGELSTLEFKASLVLGTIGAGRDCSIEWLMPWGRLLF
jgi:hypothetical protein